VFVDRVRVNLRAGSGGAGVVAFARIRGRPKGKPTGGDGGAGGDVIVQADSSVGTLLGFRHHPHHAAGNGTHGQGDRRHGKRGGDLVLLVPPGTVIKGDDDLVLADLVQPGQQVNLLRGGRGGRGNASFVSANQKAPQVAEQGEYGVEEWFTFELKLLADAALIGFPNSGKSTLISRVSAAKSKAADYPFTTLEPHLGVVRVDDREFVLADIPGLIEGAAEGKGLGHEFLRHVERARALVILLDPSPLQAHPPRAQHDVLLAELGGYMPQLLDRPRLVVINKADLPESAEAVADFPDAVAISAITGEGLPTFLRRVANMVSSIEKTALEGLGYVRHRPVEPGFTIRRQGNRWLVEGTAARRAVAFADLTVPEAADRAARRLRRLGVDRALAEAGAEAGEEVQIGELVFEFTPEEEDSQ
jgi:GTPase